MIYLCQKRMITAGSLTRWQQQRQSFSTISLIVHDVIAWTFKEDFFCFTYCPCYCQIHVNYLIFQDCSCQQLVSQWSVSILDGVKRSCFTQSGSSTMNVHDHKCCIQSSFNSFCIHLLLIDLLFVDSKRAPADSLKGKRYSGHFKLHILQMDSTFSTHSTMDRLVADLSNSGISFRSNLLSIFARAEIACVEYEWLQQALNTLTIQQLSF